MPSFIDNRQEKLYLPSTEGEPDEALKRWVTVLTGLSVGAMLDIPDGLSDTEKSLAVTAKIVVDWNNTDADGTKVPITAENLKQLSAQDFGFIGSYVAKTVNPDGGDPVGYAKKPSAP